MCLLLYVANTRCEFSIYNPYRNYELHASSCYKYNNYFRIFQALEINTVAGVFLMLFLGILIGIIILILEHLVFKYYLPGLRQKPKESIWKNRNLMFLSQVRYEWKVPNAL